MPAAVAIPAAIQAGTSIIGGVLGSRASKKAAEQQVASSAEARALIQRILGEQNPQIQATGEAASRRMMDATGSAAAGMDRAVTDANQYLDPYTELGTGAARTLGDLLREGGELNRTMRPGDLPMDPGYQARLAEGEKVLARSQSARGTAGGAALKGMARFGQDYGANEYDRAWNRHQQGQQARFGRLSSVLGTGLQAGGMAGRNLMSGAEFGGGMRVRGAEFAGQTDMWSRGLQSQNAMNAGRSEADLITGAGNARAAGTVGSANAWNGALQGVGSAAGGVASGLTLRSMMKNPALTARRGFTPPGMGSAGSWSLPTPPGDGVQFGDWADMFGGWARNAPR